VRFFFQPGEEGHGGAEIALREGLLEATDGGERASWAFAIHQSPSYPAGMVATRPGPIMASADTFEVTVRGRGGHASMPHHAADPIPVACQIVGALQTFVTRQVDVFDPAVVTVGRIAAGTVSNVIPETAVLEGTMRAVSAEARERVRDGLARVATNVAAAHDMTAEVDIRPGYPVTVNHRAPAAEVLALAGRLVGERRTYEMPTPVMGAEDFSYVIERVPGMMAFIGARPASEDPATAPQNHSNLVVFEEAPMALGVALYAAAALVD
jgi:hippurate hydrolase